MIRVVSVLFSLCLLRTSLQLSDVHRERKGKEDSGSSEYYFGYSYIKIHEEVDADLKLILINSGTQPVSYTVVAPGIDYIKSDTIPPNDQNIVDIPSEAEVTTINDQNKGIYLKASDRVNIIAQSIKDYRFDTFTLLPVTNLNVDKYTYYGISTSHQSTTSFNSSILVVGTEDHTMMELTVTQEVQVKIGQTVDNLVPNKLYSFTINRLQTVYISADKDLSGTKIATDKLVSVFSGHQNGYIEGWARGGYLAEQIPPTAYWETVHYIPPTSHIFNVVKILAAEDATNVDIYCNGIKKSHTISEGKYIEKEFTIDSDMHCVVFSDKPVLVAYMGANIQTTHDSTDGDPMLAIVLGTNQYSNRLDSSTLSPDDATKEYYHYISLVVLAEYYQPDVIHLTQGGETLTLDNDKWKPIVVDNIVNAYAQEMHINPGPYTIIHDNSAAKMMVMSYGVEESFGGYGHSAQISMVQVLPLCEPLEDIDNGRVTCSLGDDGVPTEGDTCIYVCDDGFVVNGDSVTRECQSDGSWTGSEPTCERVSCYQLEAPDNGKIECTGNHYEDVCTFSCDDGYELTGSDTRTCQSDANWSGSDTQCMPGSHQKETRKQKKTGKSKQKGPDQKQEL